MNDLEARLAALTANVEKLAGAMEKMVTAQTAQPVAQTVQPHLPEVIVPGGAVRQPSDIEKAIMDGDLRKASSLAGGEDNLVDKGVAMSNEFNPPFSRIYAPYLGGLFATIGQ
ncbi:MAG TPA: hypothetical protein VGA61_02250 [Anaerolineae bacterium]